MTKKIVLVTAGGHISSFHAAMKSMHEILQEKAPGKYELFGAIGGISGLENCIFKPIKYTDIEENRAGSLIGSDRKRVDIGKVVRSVKGNNLYVMMGGDNHLGEAAKCHESGIPFIGFSKSMDGDPNSFIPAGWHTAVTHGATMTRNHHNTAITNRRIFYVGLFGRNKDWVLAPVTLYGGGDRGIPCEQGYNWKDICEKIRESVKENEYRYGKKFAVVPFSEGAAIDGVNPVPRDHYSQDDHGEVKLQPEWIGMELVRLTKKEGMSACFQAHTYDMRDVPPTEIDKRISRMQIEEIVRMILEEDFGKAVIFRPDNKGFYETSRAPLREVAEKRSVKDTDFFGYNELKPKNIFVEVYGNFFKDPLGFPPTKDELVYKNMLSAAS